MRRFIYVGPSLSSEEVLNRLPGVNLRPPVRHGDLLREHFRAGERVLIVDGFFHQTGSVRHKEILTLLAEGVAVAGASSMGALRAAELDGQGMVGLGEVYRAYRSGEIIDDDEVTIVHDEGIGYRPLSVPLVNIRFGLRDLAGDGRLRPEAAAALLRLARRIPYPRRSWRALALAASAEPELDAAMDMIRAEIAARPSQFDAKAADARSALGWLESDTAPDLTLLGWTSRDSWRNRYIREWMTQFRGSSYESVFVSLKDAVAFAQIYDETFPRRWRRHVLSRILGLDVRDEQVVDRAEAAFGLRYSTLARTRKERWLTGEELVTLTEHEALVRILVRSAAVPPQQTLTLTDVTPDAVRCVAEATEVNRQVSVEDPARSVGRLRSDLLTEHLATIWRTSSGDMPRMTAAARDRGFRDADDAVEAARKFYMRHLLLVEPDAPREEEDVALAGAAVEGLSS